MQLVQRVKSRFEELRDMFTKLNLPEATTAIALAERALDDAVQECTPNPQDTLTLTEAAAWSGYSRGYLAAMLRKRQLTNHGRRRSPRLLRGELPVKGQPRL